MGYGRRTKQTLDTNAFLLFLFPREAPESSESSLIFCVLKKLAFTSFLNQKIDDLWSHKLLWAQEAKWQVAELVCQKAISHRND